ncbi:hypothetical protein OR334_000374 [Escherichia coli]|nr:hypothetical protein [Escherichia coli]HDQ6470860.1 hypothetical protein [Escherichia coli O25 str. E39a]EHK0700574.1 hypothetical protein [Escherichia coli]EHK1686750.1 hypothetical protein [Escherichia coli]EHK3484337.1 hypothetical protein [Escherichia coli]EHK4153764.1 hypothetical protein [Escherichia coli]
MIIKTLIMSARKRN